MSCSRDERDPANLLADRLLMPSLQRPAVTVGFACSHQLLCGRRKDHLRSTHAHHTASNKAAPPQVQAVAPSLSAGAGMVLPGSRDLPLTTVLRRALPRPRWGPGTRGWRQVGRWWGAASGLAGRLPTAATPQGLWTRSSTFQKHFTKKCLVLKLLGLFC